MSVLSDLTRPWLALSLLPGVGGATLRAIHASGQWDRRGNSLLGLAHDLDLPRLAKALDTTGALRKAEQDAEAQVKMAVRYGGRILSVLDEEFPDLLAKSRYNPFMLFVRGTLAPAGMQSVAIVGTRKPTAEGKQLAKSLGQQAAGAQWSVVSGLALGCDAAAHQGALDAQGHTVAVMAHGLHTVEPHRNLDLAKSILAKGGALVSHYPFGVDAEPRHFVQRDAIQAGLAQGVALVQSDLHGGSMHAVRASLADGRWAWAADVSAEDRLLPSVGRANLVLREGSDAEKRSLLRAKESANLEGLLDPSLPFPASPTAATDTTIDTTQENVKEENPELVQDFTRSPGP